MCYYSGKGGESMLEVCLFLFVIQAVDEILKMMKKRRRPVGVYRKKRTHG